MLHYGEKQNGAVESPLGSHIIYKSHGYMMALKYSKIRPVSFGRLSSGWSGMFKLDSEKLAFG